MRRQRDGANVVPRPVRTPAWRLLLAQLTHFFAGMLWVAALLALIAGMVALAGAIVAIVLLNGLFAFVQEHKADRAAEHLEAMMPAAARVRRGGELLDVAVADLVVDDLVLLAAGDRVGADIRLGEAHELTLDESMLTGESVPRARTVGDVVLAGTFAVQGDGSGTVVAVGAGTELAGIAALTAQAKRPVSPLSVQLHKLVLVVAGIAVAVGVVLSGAALVMGFEVTAALLLGVGVMVALVPEGLLPTVTLSLARGAQRMAGQKALVRRLEAVETLGATTFICTDKTGTLTRNEMSVVEGWTPAGGFRVTGTGYDPRGDVLATGAVADLARLAASGARGCATGRSVEREGRWVAQGDPMDAAFDTFGRRLGLGAQPVATARLPFTAATRSSAGVVDGTAYLMGAPEAVLARCTGTTAAGTERAQLADMSGRGRRVIAVARSRGPAVASDGDL